jgi:hypothetical protein
MQLTEVQELQIKLIATERTLEELKNGCAERIAAKLNADKDNLVRALRKELDEAAKELDLMRRAQRTHERDISTLIDERDAAENTADMLTSLVLRENICWSDHAAKWREAIRTLSSPNTD